MAKFKPGDKARIIASRGIWPEDVGKVVTIVQREDDTAHDRAEAYVISGLPASTQNFRGGFYDRLWRFASNLEPVVDDDVKDISEACSIINRIKEASRVVYAY